MRLGPVGGPESPAREPATDRTRRVDPAGAFLPPILASFVELAGTRLPGPAGLALGTVATIQLQTQFGTRVPTSLACVAPDCTGLGADLRKLLILKWRREWDSNPR